MLLLLYLSASVFVTRVYQSKQQQLVNRLSPFYFCNTFIFQQTDELSPLAFASNDPVKFS